MFRHQGKERLLERRCGTTAYCAPEILLKPQYNAEPADLWSCGIVLVAMVTGGKSLEICCGLVLCGIQGAKFSWGSICYLKWTCVFTDGNNILDTPLVKHYNDLLKRQGSERGKDEVSCFYVGDIFCIHLGTKYADFQEKIFAEISGKKFQTLGIT